MTEITVPVEHPDYIPQLVAYLRSKYPPGHPQRKTFSEMCEEQGKGPITREGLERLKSGPWLYEGFEEDVTRMRRGLEPIGPRK